MISTARSRFAESFDGPLPPTGLQWPGVSAEQLEFMRRVYAAHVARSAARRKFIGDVPAGELAVVEQGRKMRTAAAADCRAMLAAARSDLAAEQSAGSVRARGVAWIGITSGYRSASEQFVLWQRYFPGFYNATAATRAAAAGGPHGNAAVALTVKYVGARIAAPGYSLHNEGRAADLKTSERRLVLGASGSQRKPWRETWFWAWLVANAARFSFFQNTSIDEPWHWEHRPERAAREFESPAVPAGEKIIDTVPLLQSHKGTRPDLFLRWNAITRTDEIDVVIHFHGFAAELGKMNLVKNKLPISGLDWRDPDNPATSAKRTRPTLFILPRGNYAPRRAGDRRYTFPALVAKGALRELWTYALAQFAEHVGLSQPPRVARLILTAHSGGGAALEQVLAQYDPSEVHVFDALYQSPRNLIGWMKRHVEADAQAPSGPREGALRVFYLPTSGTEAQSKVLDKAIRTARYGRPNSVELAKRYRVEQAAVGHNQIPRRYGWQLFVDHAAEVI